VGSERELPEKGKFFVISNRVFFHRLNVLLQKPGLGSDIASEQLPLRKKSSLDATRVTSGVLGREGGLGGTLLKDSQRWKGGKGKDGS